MSLADSAGWGDALAEPLRQDASSRRYSRLTRPSGTAILMDDPEGDVALFARLSRHLTGLGLSAPRIYAEGPQQLLIEDLGRDLFADLAAKDPTSEAELYRVAAEALLVVQDGPVPEGLTIGTPDLMAEMVGLGLEWYAIPSVDSGAVKALFAETLDRYAAKADVMILRDYHAENLLWLPDRDGAARAGLLDFQDAMQGHRIYDLVSLLQDARRDVAPEVVDATCAYFRDRLGLDQSRFSAAYAVLGAQRQLRILGIFVRLARLRDKPHYLALLPRVYAHLFECLAHPALVGLRAALEPHLPGPTPDYIEKLIRR